MKVLFRADSSSKIGLGHIMRDLVLAKEFKDDEVIFVCQDLAGNIIKKIEYPVIVLNSSDIDELIDIIKKQEIDMVVIDHYSIDYEDEKKIKELTGVNLFIFDDTYERHYCDILLNHNIGADKKRYKDLVPQICELRCGSEHTLIRDEFRKEKYKKIVFVAMGGTDSKNISLEILKVLIQYENFKINLVTTSVNPNIKILKKFAKNKNIKFHIDSNKLAKLMKKSDFAIVSPSVIVHETLYMNIPFIAIMTARNQKDIYKYLKNNNYNVLKKMNEKKLKKNINKIVEIKNVI